MHLPGGWADEGPRSTGGKWNHKHAVAHVPHVCLSVLDFARSRGLRMAGSWFHRLQAHCSTWYSNAGDVAKEIDQVLAQ